MIEDMVNIRMTMESRALSDRSFISLDGNHLDHDDYKDNFEEIIAGHNKTMFLLEKRSKSLEGMLELWELGGVSKLFPGIAKTELAVQCNIFNIIFTVKPKPNFIGIDNSEALLEICFKLAKSKNNYYAEIAGKCVGIILREIGQNLCGVLATSLHVEESSQIICIKIFKKLEEICSSLKLYKRGIVELNEIEYFIEKLSPIVLQIKLTQNEDTFIR